ncbi:hypothetical protein [Frankia sp. R43]|uniref:hypothetical protein n=1 Tax=Frankia sp. R43 TaxID=269536 RepID=UPI00128F7655|nr:hypothetical protein [Frankia sp. R43]
MTISDIADVRSLVSYATVGQVDRVLRETSLNQGQIAQLLPMDAGNFTNALKDPSDTVVQKLDEVFAALHGELDRTGGLAALAVRLRRVETKNLMARIPPTWTRELLARPADDEFGVLTRASALLSILMAVPNRSQRVCRDYSDELETIVDQLILIGASPPSPRNMDALILLGSIADFAFDVVEERLHNALWSMPMGFRVWRAITTIVLRRIEAGGRSDRILRAWVEEQLNASEELRARSLFPARSLDLELAIAIPSSWSPHDNDWAARVLRSRVENTDATVRERGTAAFGLWERTMAPGGPDRGDTTQYLRTLIDQFEYEARDDDGGTATGLLWVSETLRHMIDSGQRVCNTWPDSTGTALLVVKDAVRRLDEPAPDGYSVPPRIREATRFLAEHAILQNGGVQRRQAIDALSAGSWTEAMTDVLASVLADDRSESWLRCRALFACSLLQERSREVETVLWQAFEETRRQLLSYGDHPPRGVVSEMHAVLFACGDCFGVPGAESQARRLRGRVNGMLDELMERSLHNPDLYRVARAAAYLVMVTAQTGDEVSHEFMRRLDSHPDPTTAALSAWALRQRFDQRGNVHPLYDAR